MKFITVYFKLNWNVVCETRINCSHQSVPWIYIYMHRIEKHLILFENDSRKMSNRINPRDFDFSKTRKISNERLDDSKKPITKVYYLNELVPSVKIRREVKDLGILEPPWPPAIGMDKMHTRSKSLRYIIDFAHQSSIHGLNHLVAPRRHAFER